MFPTLLRCISSQFVLEQTLTHGDTTKTLYGRSIAIATTKEGFRRVVVGAEYQKVSFEGFVIPPDTITGTAEPKPKAFEMENHGVLYVYDYNSNTQKYELKATLDGINRQDKNGIYTLSDGRKLYTRNLGNQAAISADGNRIFAGAPKTHVDKNKGDAMMKIEVGALFVYDYNEESQEWKMTKILVPQSDDVSEFDGLGRSLSVTPDGQNVASSYINRKGAPGLLRNTVGDAFVANLKDGTWGELQKLVKKEKLETMLSSTKVFKTVNILNPITEQNEDIGLTIGYYRKWGSSLQFGSSTQLLVATENTHIPPPEPAPALQDDNEDVNEKANPPIPTQIFNYKNGHWVDDEEVEGTLFNDSPDYDSFGGYMSTNEVPDRLVSGVVAKSGNRFLLVRKNPVTGLWEDKHDEILLPEGVRLDVTPPLFCGDYLLSADVFFDYDGHNKIGTAIIHKLNANKQYEVFQRVVPPKESYADLDNGTYLTFGTALSWDRSCKYFAVGAMNKRSKKSKPQAFVYKAEPESSEKQTGLTQTEVTIISVVVVVVVVVIIVGGITVWYCRRKRGSDNVDA